MLSKTERETLRKCKEWEMYRLAWIFNLTITRNTLDMMVIHANACSILWADGGYYSVRDIYGNVHGFDSLKDAYDNTAHICMTAEDSISQGNL